jgi:hypothetical protein
MTFSSRYYRYGAVHSYFAQLSASGSLLSFCQSFYAPWFGLFLPIIFCTMVWCVRGLGLLQGCQAAWHLSPPRSPGTISDAHVNKNKTLIKVSASRCIVSGAIN